MRCSIYIVMLLLGLVSKKMNSQGLSLNGVQVTLKNNSVLTVKGDILMESTSIISNDGNISLTGNWINNSSTNCIIQDGSIILNGNQQSIEGLSGTLFPSLQLAGNGTKTLNQDISVSSGGELNIGFRILDLNQHQLTLENPFAAALKDSGGYILSESVDFAGRISWKIGTESGAHSIPFGNIGGINIPVTIQTSGDDVGDVIVSTYATATDNLPLPVLPFPVSHVRNSTGVDNSSYTADRFWLIEKTGTADFSAGISISPGEAPPSGNGIMSAQLWNPVIDGWNPALPSQNNPNGFSVLVPGITNSGIWAMAASSSPLPVELIYFDARKVDQNVVVYWITATEKDNDFFTVERSDDGRHWIAVAKIKGAGTSVVQHQYNWKDEAPLPGISYYRLRQTDFNGDNTCSEAKAVRFDHSTDLYVRIFPNPATEKVYFTLFANDKASHVIEIFDASGKKVLQHDLIPLDNDQSTITIERKDLASGIYIYHLLSGVAMLKSGRFVFN